MSELSELLEDITLDELRITKVTESHNNPELDSCNPECHPNCVPSCNPQCSPNCSPCYPHGKCDPKLFG